MNHMNKPIANLISLFTYTAVNEYSESSKQTECAGSFSYKMYSFMLTVVNTLSFIHIKHMNHALFN